MKRERPPMPPLAIRVQVARRQVERHIGFLPLDQGPLHRQLAALLVTLRRIWDLPENDILPLDHNPALILRSYNPRIRDVAARYMPHAHHPDFLQYRSVDNHSFKTFGRKPGAAKTVTTKGSDVWIKSKFNRLEGRTKKPPKREWPQGRKMQSRPFPNRNRRKT
jgi:hypothetical protein